MEAEDWKDKLKQKFAGNSDYRFDESESKNENKTQVKQNLNVGLERKGRKGKTVTIVRGFDGSEDELKQLAKFLKTKCGTGGSVKDNEIIIQGDFRNQIVILLTNKGHNVKKSGG